MTGLTHLDASGAANMVDVSDKAATTRTARAGGTVVMLPETLRLIREGDAKKGDVIGTARLAGIMAAKRTPDFVPLCHPISLSGADVEVACDESAGVVRIESRVHAVDRTGVEMEALTAVMAAALTIYDMAKRNDRGMEVVSVRLVHKSGGRSGDWNRDGEAQPGAAEPLRKQR
jgi:cyclic pyranopterin phosphate synthase